jgi:predicted RNA-binding Zn-ribbon protein involved in translation (DUF1610 family)
MKRCPACGSEQIYECNKYYRYSGCGEEILPKLAPSLFSGAKIRPTVCLECGHIALFASEDARRKATPQSARNASSTFPGMPPLRG